MVSETVNALERECFRSGFVRIQIYCHASNKRSVNIPKRLGYKKEEKPTTHPIDCEDLVFSKIKQNLCDYSSERQIRSYDTIDSAINGPVPRREKVVFFCF